MLMTVVHNVEQIYVADLCCKLVLYFCKNHFDGQSKTYGFAL